MGRVSIPRWLDSLRSHTSTLFSTVSMCRVRRHLLPKVPLGMSSRSPPMLGVRSLKQKTLSPRRFPTAHLGPSIRCKPALMHQSVLALQLHKYVLTLCLLPNYPKFYAICPSSKVFFSGLSFMLVGYMPRSFLTPGAGLIAEHIEMRRRMMRTLQSCWRA